MLMQRGARPGTSTGRPSRRSVGALLFVLGLLAGALALWMGVRIYVREARIDEATLAIENRLRLPRDAFRLEDVSADGTIRMALRRVALLDRAGDTILSAPSARLSFHSTAFSGTGAIFFDRLDVQGPDLRLIQTPDGEWNLTQVFRVEADGNEVRFAGNGPAEDASRPLHFRDVRISDGRAMIATPVRAGDPLPAHFASRGGAPLVRIGGRTMQVRRVRDLDARLPLVRVGGTRGWRVEVADLDAVVSHPDTRLTDLGGWIEEVGAERYRFAVRNLRTEHSAFAGSGEFRLTEERVMYDVRLRAAPLDFRDLRGLGFAVPTGGQATLTLAVRSLPAGRTSLTSTDLVVTTPDSRASGRFAVVAGGNRPWAFTDTRIALEPLDLRTVRQMGFADLPYTGEIRGTVASLDRVEQGRGGSLRIDLVGSFLPSGGGGESSTVAAAGNVAVGGGAGLRMEGVRVEARPLRLAALAPLMPERAEQLRGILRGTATVSGTPRALRVDDGNLAYEVGSAPPTRVTGLTANVSLDPQLRYELRGRAAPLALATLTELYPALPFRTAALSG
ncbi:MAG TPA: hypothetical protein VHG28_14770, partial [Longimicrobiaceae bacterium]|nr:hypothetical protein [Longimicrobiaceae bacterium]